MNTITILSLVALMTIGLALIHETRLRRGTYYVLCRLIQSFGRNGKARDRAQVGR